MPSEISSIVKEKAPLIMAGIGKADRILLHCHPSPDPDSVGSVLAMKLALERLGKKVTVIEGDSDLPKGFAAFPGAKDIVSKSFGEVDLKDFDLFISIDSAQEENISRYEVPKFPLPIRSVVIDHHATNRGYADVNLVDPTYPAVALILFDLFKIWNMEINADMAANLFAGIYTDTGGFKYEGVTARTFIVASELAAVFKGFPKLISEIENTNTPAFIAFEGLALSSVRTFCGGKLAIAAVPCRAIKEKGIVAGDIRAGEISTLLRTVPDWKISLAMIECEEGKVRVSARSLDADKYDVSKLLASVGGGGHRAAAGAVLMMPLEKAVDLIVSKATEMYNL